MRPVPDFQKPLLELREITLKYGYKTILKNINLALKNREILLLAGPNGAGKSSLLRVIAGIHKPHEGWVSFQGIKIQEEPERYRRHSLYLSNNPPFYRELTAIENLLFWGRFSKPHLSLKTIVTALEKVNLSLFSQAQIKTYSTGMVKRLAIAYAQLLEPKLLLLDEPYNGLDISFSEYLTRYLQSFKQKGGSVLLVSHQLEHCYSICDRGAILHKSQCQLSMKIQEHPFSSFMRQYEIILKTN